MQEIFHRRSIRKYLDIPVSRTHINKILRAAMAAPSARNQQPWEFYVISNKEILQQLSEVHPYSKVIAGAPLCFIACRRTENLCAPDFAIIDVALAVENMLLEIDHCGLGACWISTCPIQERMEKAAKILNLPDNLEVFAMIPCGYPAQEPPERDNYKDERVHYIF